MPHRIYVGNLSYRASEQELRDLFSGDGSRVEAVKIVNDSNTGKSRGFGFVEVTTRQEMERETKRLNGFLFKGRNLVVGEAKANFEKAERRRAAQV
ncbi:MAG: RNA-binding protein [Acidimicrobiia bacterium]|nr:RNA-binding protein [Acidimicrobiia bacterium]